MVKQTKGTIEAEISTAIIKLEKELVGRGPTEIKTHIIDDAVFVRLEGVLTRTEKHLSKTAAGSRIIKDTHVELLETVKDVLGRMIQSITGFSIKSLHADISTKTGDKIFVFILEKNLEKLF